MSSTSLNDRSAADQRLLDSLQHDLRLLSTEAKRKHPPLKEAAESGIAKVRNAATKNQALKQALTADSPEILEPFFMGCDTKNPKVVQICITAIQRLITFEAVSQPAAVNIITCLWNLMENGVEELKVLQTVTLLIVTNTTVQGDTLSKALVLCFRLHFTKNSTTNNTASATVRQLVSAVFERVVNEPRPSAELAAPSGEELKNCGKVPPKSLLPCAADAYMLFQDLVQMVNADQPLWLLGLTEMTRTFGLELIQSILTSFPNIFLDHPEFNFLLKERVCPLVIKLFSPNIKFRHGHPMNNANISGLQSPEKPFFPITMRLVRVVSILIQSFYESLVTECEIFLSLIVKFLDNEKPPWQRVLALEVLYRICTQPELLKSFCRSYDMKPHSTKIFQDIVNALGCYIQSLFLQNASVVQSLTAALAAQDRKQTEAQATLVAGMPVGPGVTPQPAFSTRGVWMPLLTNIANGAFKPIVAEMLEKLDPPSVPEGYGVTLGYVCLIEIIKCINLLIQNEDCDPRNNDSVAGDGEVVIGDNSGVEHNHNQVVHNQSVDTSSHCTCDLETKALHEQLIESSWCGLLAALSLLLEASTDDSATENILKSMQTYAGLCGALQLTTPRDAFITGLCKASLPPHYTLTVLSKCYDQTSGKGGKNGTTRGSPDMTYQPPSAQPSLGPYLGGNDSSHEASQQVVAVGTPLPTPSLPLGAQQGPVMLTAKNLQCMRALLGLAHCHGAVLGTAWHLVLTTLQHLVWILGLKPSTGGSLKACKTADSPNAVITTAAMSDLPVLSAMLSRLFESSQYLDEVALHHLIDALCKLSAESMELAYNNREPSLFAVAKLLETGLVNLHRVDVLWRPVTSHLIEVCQHPHVRMREWGAEAITYLVKSSLNHTGYSPPLKDNPRLQHLLLSPLVEMGNAPHADIRIKQLDCTQTILHSNGEILVHGWPQILSIIGAIDESQSDALIRSAFQCVQLVVADFVPIMPCTCVRLVIETVAKYGAQPQDLNVALTAVGLLWNVADYLYQNKEKMSEDLAAASGLSSGNTSSLPSLTPSVADSGFSDGLSSGSVLSSFDSLWMCLFSSLGDLCVDPRSAVRKSSGQTLFSTLNAHGTLLEHSTWQAVLWQVLFPLLDRVRNASGSASTEKVNDMGGNILIHHSRNTAQKQWAETQVLTLNGVARVFQLKKDTLQMIGDFPRAWALLLEFIENAALSKNNEVSLSALKSFQDMLLMTRCAGGGMKEDSPTTDGPITSPGDNNNSTITCHSGDDTLYPIAWKVWYNIGAQATQPPPDAEIADAHNRRDLLLSIYIPSQAFLTALVQTFPHLFHHIRKKFVSSDLQKLCSVLRQAVAAPAHGDASPFILPSLADVVLSPLQDAVLSTLDTLQKEALNGSENIQCMLPAIFEQLLQFVTYACHAPAFGKLVQTRVTTNTKNVATDWATMSYVPFGEKALDMAVQLYTKTVQWPSVIQANILHSIVKTLDIPLRLKYHCPSQSTWKLAVSSFLAIIHVGYPIAIKHVPESSEMWTDIAKTMENFLFSSSQPPPTQSLEEQQNDEVLDTRMVHLIRDCILPMAHEVPRHFVLALVALLNRGSIHSATSTSPVDIESSRKLREEFARTCFETLLQFSFLGRNGGVVLAEDPQKSPGVVNRLAVASLLHRFREVIVHYVEDERLSGKCPLPRHRMAEISFVLKALATLVASLKQAPRDTVEAAVWQQLIGLYPHLVDCTTSTSAQVCRSLREALKEYADLLTPPQGCRISS